MKAPQLLGQQFLPPLTPTSSTHSYIPGRPDPRSQEQSGLPTSSIPLRPSPEHQPLGSCMISAYLWQC